MRSSSTASRRSPSRIGLGRRRPEQRRIGERRPAEERERLAEQSRRVGRRLLARERHERLEALEVELARLERDRVAGRTRDDRVARPERVAQPGDVDLERLGGRRRRILAPQHVDQPVRRHRLLPPREQQRRQQRALLGRPELDRPVRPDDAERPQDRELHRFTGALPRRHRLRRAWRRAYRDKPSAGHTLTHRQGGAPCPCVATRGQPACVASGPCGRASRARAGSSRLTCREAWAPPPATSR